MRRYTFEGRTYRVLDCGNEHSVEEGHGGRSASATFVRGCLICNAALNRPAAKPVIGVCSAIVRNPRERHARACGKPATGLKREQPRCAWHLKRGAA